MLMERAPRNENPEIEFHNFRDLARYWKENYGDDLKATTDEQAIHGDAVKIREEGVESYSLEEVLQSYGLRAEQISRRSDDLFDIPSPKNLNVPALPEGYGYKGGVARLLLREYLGLETTHKPRDLDIVRTGEPNAEMDAQISQRYMPDDYEHGYGVEPLGDLDTYFQTRDITMNEVLVINGRILATEQAILDTSRGIIRLTEFERDRSANHHKMLAKVFRFYAQSIVEFEQEHVIADKDMIDPDSLPYFWMALHLDRAFSQGGEQAEEYVRQLVKHDQLPSEIKSAKETVIYLQGKMMSDDFYYRHAPVEQFDTENEWARLQEEREDDLYDIQDRLGGIV